MLNFEDITITKDTELFCAVCKIEDNVVFSDELIELLFLQMKEKWLSLKAFRHIFIEEEQEERLYIAFDPYLNKGKADILEKEVRLFFSGLNANIVFESGRKVKAMSRNGYKAVITNTSLSQLSKRLSYRYDPYYKPYLLGIGLSDEDVKSVLSKLENINRYLWYRTKRKYIGVNITLNSIDTYLEDFVCLNKDDQWEVIVQAMKDYQSFVDNERQDFIKKYTKQEEKRKIRDKILKGEIEEIETTIILSDELDFLKANNSGSKNWKALEQLYARGWNNQHIKGYREDSKYFIDNDEVLSFINNNYYRRFPLSFDSYVTAIRKYLEYRWNLKHRENEEEVEAELNKETDEKTRKAAEEEFEQITDKKIRIDINMDNIDDFMDYLESREPNRQQRERYVERLKDFKRQGWNEYRHTTYIDDNRYRVNAKDVEVFVNGMNSKDFNVKVKEYEDAIELYLAYRWAKDYGKPKEVTKVEAIPPVVKERKKKIQNSDSRQDSKEGKKIFATIKHLESWKSDERGANPTISEGPTVQYIGEPSGQRESASLRSASIKEDEHSVGITFDLNATKEQDIISETPSSDDVLPSNDVLSSGEKRPSVDNKQTDKKVQKKDVGNVIKTKDVISKKQLNKGWLAKIMLRFWTWYYKWF